MFFKSCSCSFQKLETIAGLESATLVTQNLKKPEEVS